MPAGDSRRTPSKEPSEHPTAAAGPEALRSHEKRTTMIPGQMKERFSSFSLKPAEVLNNLVNPKENGGEDEFDTRGFINEVCMNRLKEAQRDSLQEKKMEAAPIDDEAFALSALTQQGHRISLSRMHHRHSQAAKLLDVGRANDEISESIRYGAFHRAMSSATTGTQNSQKQTLGRSNSKSFGGKKAAAMIQELRADLMVFCMDSFKEKKKHGKLCVGNFTEDRWFNVLVTGAILLNAIVMGVEVDYPQYVDTYKGFELFFTSIFTWEMLCKMYFEKWAYFKNNWNKLDFFLVTLSNIDVVLFGLILQGGGDMKQLSVLRILRVIRVVKLVRLLKAFKELWLIVKGMINALPTIFWASCVLLMLLYVFGIFCTTMVGHNLTAGYYRSDLTETPDFHPDFDAYQHFGTVPRSMYTLFEMALDPLPVTRPVLEKQMFMLPFILIFVLFTTFGVLNVIIGVIVESTMATAHEQEEDVNEQHIQEQFEAIERIQKACARADTNQNGWISIDEVRAAWKTDQLQDLLEELMLPCSTPEEFFLLIDQHGQGSVTAEDFIKYLGRSITSNIRQNLMDLKIGLHQLERTYLLGISSHIEHGDKARAALDEVEFDLLEYYGPRLLGIEDFLRDIGQRLGASSEVMSKLKRKPLNSRSGTKKLTQNQEYMKKVASIARAIRKGVSTTDLPDIAEGVESMGATEEVVKKSKLKEDVVAAAPGFELPFESKASVPKPSPMMQALNEDAASKRPNVCEIETQTTQRLQLQRPLHGDDISVNQQSAYQSSFARAQAQHSNTLPPPYEYNRGAVGQKLPPPYESPGAASASMGGHPDYPISAIPNGGVPYHGVAQNGGSYPGSMSKRSDGQSRASGYQYQSNLAPTWEESAFNGQHPASMSGMNGGMTGGLTDRVRSSRESESGFTHSTLAGLKQQSVAGDPRGDIGAQARRVKFEPCPPPPGVGRLLAAASAGQMDDCNVTHRSTKSALFGGWQHRN